MQGACQRHSEGGAGCIHPCPCPHPRLFLLSIGLLWISAQAITRADCTVAAGDNGGGGDNNELGDPYATVADDAGSVYVADMGNHRIMKWSAGATTGVLVAGGTYGSGSNEMARPMDVKLTSEGYLVVAEQGSPGGKEDRITRWLPGASSGTVWVADADLPYPPLRMHLLSSGELLVVFSKAGATEPRPVYKYSADGTGTAWYSGDGIEPTDVAADSSGMVYAFNDPGGAVVRFPATQQLTGGDEVYPTIHASYTTHGFAVFEDSSLEFWVTIDSTNSVLKCVPSVGCSTFLHVINEPVHLSFETSGNGLYIYVTERTGHRVIKCPTGKVPTTRTFTTSTPTTTTTSSTTISFTSTTTSSTTTSFTSTTTSSATISSTSTTTSSATTSSTSTTTSSATTSSTSTTTSSVTTTSTSSATTSSTSTTTSTGTTSSSSTTTSSATTSSTSTTTSSATTSSTSTTTSSASTTTTSFTTSSTSTTATSSTTSTVSSTSTTTSITSSTSTSTSSSTTSSTSTTSTSSTTSTTSSATSSSTSTTTSSATTSSTSTTTTSATTSTTSSATTTSTSTVTTSTSTTTGSTTTSSTSATTSTTTTSTTNTSTTSTRTSTSSTTSTSTSSSTVTTPLAPPAATDEPTAPKSPSEVAGLLEAAVAAVTLGLLDQLKGGADEATASLPDAAGTLTAVQLGGKENLANSSSDSITVSVTTGGDGATEVTLPSAVFEGLDASSVAGDSLSLVVAFFSSSRSASLGGQQEDVGDSGIVEFQVVSAVAIDLRYLLSGESPPVGNLDKPIVFLMPGVNYTPGVRCTYWSEEAEGWSFKGVEAPREGNVEGQPLVCHTYHLSFFAAILEAFISTLQCTQLGLLSAAAIKNLFEDGSWMRTQSAWICWAIFAAFLLAMGFAAVLDFRRALTHRWRDEFFLVAAATEQEFLAGDAERPEEMGDEPEAEEEEAGKAPSQVAKALAGGLLVASTCLQCLYESSALREALDEILSSWFDYWGQLRGACESLCEVFAAGATVDTLSHRTAVTFLMASSRRMVASSLNLSNDAVTFVLEDEDLQDFLTQGHGDSAAVGTRAHDWRTTEDQRMAWTSLHDSVVHHVLEHSGRHTLRNLPYIIRDFFLYHNPVGALFVVDIFHSCKKRVLLLGVDLFGALAMSCVFFEATGLVRGKPVGEAEDCGRDDSFAGRIGRFLAIATGALLVASVPVAIIDSFQTKGFRKLDYRGSEAWKKQLRIWAIQDRIVWTFGILYIAFCVFFVLVFLASIGPEDHEDWSSAGLFALGEDFAVMPAFMAIAVPTTTAASLHLHSRVHRTDPQTALRQSQTTLTKKSNLMLPITQI